MSNQINYCLLVILAILLKDNVSEGGRHNYPKKKIISILDKNKDVLSYFGEVIKPGGQSVQSRFGFEGPQTFCKTRVRTTTPEWLLDVDDVNRTIANTGMGSKYVQALTYEECLHSGRPCYAGAFLKTKCLPVFNTVKLLTINLKTEEAEYHSFQVPSTCVCSYT